MSIEAMKQALEALQLAKSSHNVTLMSYPPKDAWIYNQVDQRCGEAIVVLRQAIDAIEKPSEPPIYVQRATNDFENGWEEGFKSGAQLKKESTPRNVDPRLLPDSDVNCTTLPQAEKQEPVAWMYRLGADIQINLLTPEYYGDHWSKTALYAAPPRKEWVGLTDEEILQTLGVKTAEKYFFKIVRAIEAKLKERNNGL